MNGLSTLELGLIQILSLNHTSVIFFLFGISLTRHTRGLFKYNTTFGLGIIKSIFYFDAMKQKNGFLRINLKFSKQKKNFLNYKFKHKSMNKHD